MKVLLIYSYRNRRCLSYQRLYELQRGQLRSLREFRHVGKDTCQQVFKSSAKLITAPNIIHASIHSQKTLKNTPRPLKPEGTTILSVLVKSTLSGNTILGTVSDYPKWRHRSDFCSKTEGYFLTRAVWDEVLSRV